MPDAPHGAPLCAALLAKIHEQIERTRHLIGLVPVARLHWTPQSSGWTTGELSDHLADCMAGFCAVLAAAEPERLAHFEKLKEWRGDAKERVQVYLTGINEGFALLTDADLARRVPTVFRPAGESLLTLFLGNLEHLINHKYQLFVYLKQMGVQVATPDLYQFR